LVQIGSLQVTFEQGMLISTTGGTQPPTAAAVSQVTWAEGQSQNQNFPGFAWTQVVISLLRINDVKASVRVFWDGILKKEGEIDLPDDTDVMSVGWSPTSDPHDPTFRGEIKHLYVVNRVIDDQTRGMLRTAFTQWQENYTPTEDTDTERCGQDELCSCPAPSAARKQMRTLQENPLSQATHAQQSLAARMQSTATDPYIDAILFGSANHPSARKTPYVRKHKRSLQEAAPAQAGDGQQSLAGGAQSSVPDSYIDAILGGGPTAPLGVVGGSLITLEGFFNGAPMNTVAVTVGGTPCTVLEGESSETSLQCKLGHVNPTAAELDTFVHARVEGNLRGRVARRHLQAGEPRLCDPLSAVDDAQVRAHRRHQHRHGGRGIWRAPARAGW
jgi:hypothetical protein